MNKPPRDEFAEVTRRTICRVVDDSAMVWTRDDEAFATNRILAAHDTAVAAAETRLLAQMQSKVIEPFVDPMLGTVDFDGVAEATIDFIGTALDADNQQGDTSEKA